MAPPDSDDEDGEKKKGDGKKKKGDGKNKRKRNDDTIGSQEADSNDSKTTKKLRKKGGEGSVDEASGSRSTVEGDRTKKRKSLTVAERLHKKISKFLTQADVSLEVLTNYKNALRDNPKSQVLKDIDAHVQVITGSFQQFRTKLLAEQAKRSEVIFSWRTVAPEIIPGPYNQDDVELNNCWVVALQRVIFSLMKKRGLPNELSIDDIFFGVESKYINGCGGGIKKLHHAIHFLASKGIQMDVYRRPKLEASDELHQKFESLIEESLYVDPVVVTVDCTPSFISWCREGAKGVYYPSDDDLNSRKYEKFERHCLYLSAHGKEKGGIRFFEVEDSFGKGRGIGGFIRFVRDLCLVRELAVLKLQA